MQQLTVKAVYDCIDRFAPFETAESYDNVGLLVGQWDQPVTRLLCTLDVTEKTVHEALSAGAELIVSHHPLMFHGRKSLIVGDPEADTLRALIVSGISLISAHTNWDQSCLSGSAASAEAIGVTDLRQEGYLFTGDLPVPASAGKVKALIEQRIGAPVRLYGDQLRQISTMSFGGGAFGEGYLAALAAGAQAYLTGEIRHHEIIDAVARGLVIFDAGHYASEAPMIPCLMRYLRENLTGFSPARIIQSSLLPFSGALL